VRYALVILFVGLSGLLQAQKFLGNIYNDRYFSVNLGLGQTSYLGELNHRFQLEESFSHINLGFEVRLLNHIGARTELIMFRMSGKDSDAKDGTLARQRNLSFESKNFEANFQVLYYLFPYNDIYRKRHPMEPFIAAGVGLATLNPKTSFIDSSVKLKGLKTEGVDYSGTALVFPVGIGVKFKLNHALNLIVESSYRLTFEDYFDDVSAGYVSSFDTELGATLANRKGEVGIINPEFYNQLALGGKRGNSTNSDNYLSIAFKFEYYIPGKFFARKENTAEN